MITRFAVAAAMLAATGLTPGNASAADERGLKVGSKAPAFTLKDQHGKEQSLEALLKKGNVALVFYRSADW